MAKKRRKQTKYKRSSAKYKKKRKSVREPKTARAEKQKNKPEKQKYPIFTTRLKRWIGAVLLMLFGAIIALSFVSKAGNAGQKIFDVFSGFIGKTVFFVPLLFFCGAFLLIKPQKKRILAPVILSLIFLIAGISGILSVENMEMENGGWLGSNIVQPIFNNFGIVVAWVVCSVLIVIGFLIMWEFMPKKKSDDKKFKPAQLTNVKQLSPEEQAKLDEKPKFEIRPIELLRKKHDALARQDQSLPAQKPSQGKIAVEHGYKMPPLSLFDTVEEKSSAGDTDYNALMIKKTLLNFGIEVEMAEINTGPTVAQYTLKPAEGVKLSKLTSLNNDLALALAAHPIRIEAPIPGRSLVGIEVPNKERALVKLGNLAGLADFLESKSPLSMALGKDVMGRAIFPNLGAMPHMLVAGATGTGKTICLNSLILSLIFRNSPKALRLVLIDPKRVEFPVYSNLPHLLTPVIFNPQKAVNALNWLVGEMERRFDVLKDAGSRDIKAYNKAIKEKQKRQAGAVSGEAETEEEEKMPYIILIIDELADLMMSRGKEVEAGIVRISQLARAVGIHLIVATQRPSVEVITGLIKANITSRVAFQVASQIDSRTILDTAGAEKLLGKGDMLFLSSEFSKPRRVQGSFITSAEMKKIVKFIVKENAPEEVADLEAGQDEQAGPSQPRIDIDDNALSEPLYNEAKDVVMQYGKASASLLQRRLRVGYARAARILDVLEENGVVGPQEGSKPRDVYIKHANESGGFQDASDVETEYK